METYTLPFVPPNMGTIHIASFESVTNAAAIRKRLVEAARMEGEEGEAARAAVDFAFVDADLVSLRVCNGSWVCACIVRPLRGGGPCSMRNEDGLAGEEVLKATESCFAGARRLYEPSLLCYPRSSWRRPSCPGACSSWLPPLPLHHLHLLLSLHLHDETSIQLSLS